MTAQEIADRDLELATRPDNQVSEPAAESKEAAKTTTEKPERKVYNEFRGNFHNKTVRRFISSKDEATGQSIRDQRMIDGVTNSIVTAIVGKGTFRTTGEPYITVDSQWNPGRTCRLTFSAQNLKPASDALFKENLDTKHPDATNTKEKVYIPLLRQMKVTAYGEMMTSQGRDTHGMQVEELYIINDDGTSKVVIAAAQAQQAITGDVLANLLDDTSAS